MKLWHISDTHGYHDMLLEPEGIDVICFSGDCSNSGDRTPETSAKEIKKFVDWFSKLKAPYKIMIAGNHDIALERKELNIIDYITDRGIIYLENSYVTVLGTKFYGLPQTLKFGYGWAFNSTEYEIRGLLNVIDKDTDVIISHGPPKYFLDLADSEQHVGSYALFNYVSRNWLELKGILFGHIHRYGLTKGVLQAKITGPTIYSNGACVTDFNFGDPLHTFNGNIIELP